jgi:hypothetical protein
MSDHEGAVDLQRFEDRTVLRIKFASLLGEGPRFVGDAGVEYQGFFDALPDGWSITGQGLVETINEYVRTATRLSSEAGDVVLVEHETGLEILFAVGAGAALFEQGVELTRWAWSRWQERREQTKPARRSARPEAGTDALIVERTTRAPDGTVTQERAMIPGSRVSDELLAAYLTGTSELRG